MQAPRPDHKQSLAQSDNDGSGGSPDVRKLNEPGAYVVVSDKPARTKINRYLRQMRRIGLIEHLPAITLDPDLEPGSYDVRGR